MLKTLIFICHRALRNGIYFGLSLHTSNLGGNPFLNCLISGAVEIPAFMSMPYLFKKAGRIKAQATLLYLAGLILLLTAIPFPKGTD